MRTPLEQVLHDLRSDCTCLGRQDDAIGTLLAEIEESLRKIGKVPVSVKMGRSILSWAKHASTWRLLHETPDGHVAPLANAPREVRADVFLGRYLEALLLRMREEIQAQLNERGLAIERANEFLTLLNTGKE